MLGVLRAATQDLAPMYELSHALAAILLPPTGAMPLLLAAWWLRPRHRRLAVTIFAGALLGLWLGSTELGAQWLQQRLLPPEPALTPQRLASLPPRPTAIVVLGAGGRTRAPEFGEPQLKELGLERLRYGIRLARQCACPLLFTGGELRHLSQGRITEAALAQQAARRDFGFALDWLEDRAQDTRENARYSAPLLTRAGVQRVLLVTHELHMPRAMRAFRQALPPQVELVAAPVGVSLPEWEWRDALPSQAGVAKARYLGYEWLAWWAGH